MKAFLRDVETAKKELGQFICIKILKHITSTNILIQGKKNRFVYF